MSISEFPRHLITTDTRGFERLKVDVGQTDFFLGNEQRFFHEFNIPNGSSVWFRFTSPIDFILFEQTLTVDNGGIRFTAYTGGTPSGTWTPVTTVIPKNSMSSAPPYVRKVNIDTGGNLTGGNLREVVRLVSPGSTAQRTTVSGGNQTERGLPAGTYYLQLENIANNSDSTGVYTIAWAERQPRKPYSTF